MRYALALLLLAACGSETSAPSPADVPCGGACGLGTTCVSGRCEAVDAGPTDTGAMPDLLDVQAADAPSDAPAPDTATEPEASPKARTPREGTKQATLIAMLRAPDGATIEEIMAATGWQSHTVRGAMAGALKKKLGLEVTSEKVEGRGRVYRLT